MKPGGGNLEDGGEMQVEREIGPPAPSEVSLVFRSMDEEPPGMAKSVGAVEELTPRPGGLLAWSGSLISVVHFRL